MIVVFRRFFTASGVTAESLSVEKTADLTGHNAGIFALSFTRDGRYLASG